MFSFHHNIEEEKEFITNLLLEKLPLIQEFIRCYIQDIEDTEKIFQKIVQALLKNTKVLKKLEPNLCTTYILYTTKANIKKYIQKYKNGVCHEKFPFLEESEEFYGVLWVLPEEERDILLYKDLMNYSDREIRKIMNVQDVDEKLRTARKNLLDALKPRGEKVYE